MRLVTWNVAHQAKESPIPPALYACLRALVEERRPDVLVLTEFVDGPSREHVHATLEGLGFSRKPVVSDRYHTPRGLPHNQVLITARVPLKRGDLEIPALGVPGAEAAARPNFLHAKLPSAGLEIVGLRAPAYKVSAERKAYWRAVREIAATADTRDLRLVLIGDLNASPAHQSPGGQALRHLRQVGWQVPNPVGDWSYRRRGAKSPPVTSKIDHVIARPPVRVLTAEWVTEVGGHALAGREDAPSDHAALCADLADDPPPQRATGAGSADA
jgi:endonuclease/exonuclease/phosphatase family metal-dependent hydrolase